MTMLSLLESPIPPEAPPDEPGLDEQEAIEQSIHRFTELADRGLIWDPDTASPGRSLDTEAILLENRGLTSQNRCNPARRSDKHQQRELWRSQTTLKNSVAAKLRVLNMDTEAAKLELCHSYYTVCQCNDCGAVRKFPNRCDLFFCPECAGAIAHEREKQTAWWVALVKQPKHVVLTLKNVPDLSPGHVTQLQKWFGLLRRRQFARNWVGGFYRIEVTNEGKGWHLHLHALVEAKWIDKSELSRIWKRITNGIGRIVDVRDCRAADYLHKVQGYVVKGAQLAAWTPEKIRTFIHAFTGKRTFGVFGSLYGARTEFAEFIASLKTARPKCDCGSCSVTYYSEADWIVRELQSGSALSTSTAPPVSTQRPLALNQSIWPD